MPICPTVTLMNLAGLSVAYRGSESPQLVDVRVETKGKARNTMARLAMRTLCRAIELGAAGGAELPPTAGSCKLIQGSFGPEGADAKGPKFGWTLELAGVSPRFLRVFVEQLSNAGASPDVPVESMTIAGTLPPSDDPLSIREGGLIPWLDDPDAYPGAWPDPGFELAYQSVPRGATVTIQLAGAATPEIVESLTSVLTLWGTVTTMYPNAARAVGNIGLMTPMPRISRKKLDVIARWDMFDCYPPPRVAVLTNMLARFHRTVSPIVRVEYAYP